MKSLHMIESCRATRNLSTCAGGAGAPPRRELRAPSKRFPRRTFPQSFAVFALLASVFGCFGESKDYQTAPISGLITLDGKALPGATVKFTPLRASETTINTGPEAIGTTDEDGRYSLISAFNDKGATVGKNQVMISTLKTETDPKNLDKVNIISKERVPDRYSIKPLTFDVTKEGSDAANFDLKSK